MRKKSTSLKKSSPKRKPIKSVTLAEQNPAAVDVQALLSELRRQNKGKKGTRGR